MYDSYQACVAMAGATCRPVTLRPRAADSYVFDPTSCAVRSRRRPSCCSSTARTNPTGKVFTRSELALIVRPRHLHDLIVVTDECTSTSVSTA